jgi:hypothetical protein
MRARDVPHLFQPSNARRRRTRPAAKGHWQEAPQALPVAHEPTASAASAAGPALKSCKLGSWPPGALKMTSLHGPSD